MNVPRALRQAGWWAVTVDAMLAVLLAAVAWFFGGLRPASPAEMASLVLILAALVVRRPWPWVAWTLGLAGGLIQVADGFAGLVALAGVVLVLYSVTAYGPRLMLPLTGLILPAAAVAGSVTLLQRGIGVQRIAYALVPGSIPGGAIGREAVLYLAVLAPVAATYLAGLARRSVLAAQQAAVRESLAAADSERAAELAVVQGQRAELAREVHDLVGHSLAVIIAQADSVRFRDLAAAEAPEQVQATVAAIAATARDSLGDIREVLTRLGSTDAAEDASPAGDTLPELFARVRQAGVALTVRHEGEPSDAGPDERAVLVAVTRELLTNALRHGDRAAPVDVLLRWSPDGVLIQVRNRVAAGEGAGPAGTTGSAEPAGSARSAGPAGSGAGLGIPGLQARLSRVGGRLGTDREPRPDGGQDFVADAWVPGRAG